MSIRSLTGWAQCSVKDLIHHHYSGPSPTCEERPRHGTDEWGLLKTTAITWERGWDASQHKVPPSQYWNHPELEVRDGDVLVTKAGPRQRVGVVTYAQDPPPRLMASGKMVGLRPTHHHVLPSILAGLLSTAGPQKFLDQRTTGMAESQVNFSNEVLLETPVLVPPLDEQRRIADILDTLDDAIRKTEEIIAKLQKAKQGLLHDLLTRGVDENGELRDPERHPEQFKERVVGLVPKDWEILDLGTCLAENPRNGYSPSEVDWDTGVSMLGLSCLTEDGFQPLHLKHAPVWDGKFDAATLADGDLLMSRSNTRDSVGLTGIYRDIGRPCIYPDLMMRLRPSTMVYAEYLDCLLRSPLMRKQIQRVASGTSGSMVKINARSVSSLMVALPGSVEQSRILEAVARSSVLLASEERILHKLRAIESGLMDDLLTGRVRVPEAEEALT